MTEGNYVFEWTETDATGTIEGEYSQTIYGDNLSDAIATYLIQHGEIAPDENGVKIVIKKIAFESE